MNDPYEILGLPHSADETEIRRRYLELVRQFPPDRAGPVRRDPGGLRRLARSHGPSRGQALRSALSKRDSLETIGEELRGRLKTARFPLSLLASLGRLRMSDPGEIESVLVAVPRMAGGGTSRRREPGRRDPDPGSPCTSRPAVRPGRPRRGIHGPAPGTQAPDQEHRGMQEQAESLLPPFAPGHRTLSLGHAPGRTGGVVRRQANRRGPGDPRRGTRSLPRRDREGPRSSQSNRLRASSWQLSTGCTRLCPGCAASSARYHRQMREVVEREARGMNQDWLDSLLEGFELIHNRVRRVLKSEAIEPIACLGLPVDPERMIVIETTDSTDWPPQTGGRRTARGYTWKGRVLRLAEVRAVRGRRDRGSRGTRRRSELAESRDLRAKQEPADEVDPRPTHLHEPRQTTDPGQPGWKRSEGETNHGDHPRHRPGNDQQRGRDHPRRPTRRPGRGRRSDLALGRGA